MEELRIKEYNHWNMYLHPNQIPSLGRTIVRPRRQITSISQINGVELDELMREVFFEWSHSIKRLWGRNEPKKISIDESTERGLIYAEFTSPQEEFLVVYGLRFGRGSPDIAGELQLRSIYRDLVREISGIEEIRNL